MSNISIDEQHLRPLRDQIDQIDDQVLALLKQRFDVVDQVMKLKQAHNIPASIQSRVDQVHDRNVETATSIDLPTDFASGLYSYIINYTCAMEADIMPQGDNADERLPSNPIKAA